MQKRDKFAPDNIQGQGSENNVVLLGSLIGWLKVRPGAVQPGECREPHHHLPLVSLIHNTFLVCD